MPANPTALARRRERYVSAPIPRNSTASTSVDECHDVEELSNQVLAMTIADEGPTDPQPSRLWTSRADFQTSHVPITPQANPEVVSAIYDTLHQVKADSFATRFSQAMAATPAANPPTSETESSGDALPRRLPRTSAAQKSIQTQLNIAGRIRADVGQWEQRVAHIPTLQLYYELRHYLKQAQTSLESLNSQDRGVREAREELSTRLANLRGILAQWSKVVCTDEPKFVDTSQSPTLLFFYPGGSG